MTDGRTDLVYLNKADPDAAFVVLDRRDPLEDGPYGLRDNAVRPAPGFVLGTHGERLPAS